MGDDEEKEEEELEEDVQCESEEKVGGELLFEEKVWTLLGEELWPWLELKVWSDVDTEDGGEGAELLEEEELP